MSLIMTFGVLPSFAADVEEPHTAAPAKVYVLEKLRNHDIVFMGTTHRQPLILALLAELLPHLHVKGWTLGLTRCIAIAPAEPYELVDGVIVY